jgi:uncharacterized protein
MESALYTGTLRHRRSSPAHHDFTVPLFMAFLDIDRLPELMRVSPFAGYNRFGWASFHERDHFGDPALSLRERLRQDAGASGLALPDGPIYLLTHLRYLGYVFNPISLFYCYDRRQRLQQVLAEVNSTFGETCNYWLPAGPGGTVSHRCPKKMHVSPFLPMELDYQFVLPAPGGSLVAHIGTSQGPHRPFDATLRLQREDWTAAALHRALRRFPWMTAQVMAGIHWQALRLYLKKVPVVPHPARQGKGAQL